MSQSKALSCKSLHEYLKTWPADTLNSLYNHPAACMGVLRELPELARNVFMRIFSIDKAVFQAGITNWVSQAHQKDMESSLQALTELQVLKEINLKGLPSWQLNENFKKNIKFALFGGEKPRTFSVMQTGSKGKDISYLNSYAMKRWEYVLRFMVGTYLPDGISAETFKILLHAGLMTSPFGRDESKSHPAITKEGIKFLLMDTASQVWYFLLKYLDKMKEQKQDLVKHFSFLLELSFSKLGKQYSTTGLSSDLLVFLQSLREFGLVYQRKRTGTFYPTQLVVNIISSSRHKNINIAKPGYIIVETNYRVYAHTKSDFQAELLSLMCKRICRFPNLCVTVLTRESVCAALSMGITADQMVRFLHMNAHPCMLKGKEGEALKNVLPPTIVDQIKLWELEKNRFVFTDSVLYNQFESQNDFEILRNYAQDLGVLVWQKEQTRTMAVSKEGVKQIKTFWKLRSKSSA